jgi:hypothetical protein
MSMTAVTLANVTMQWVAEKLEKEYPDIWTNHVQPAWGKHPDLSVETMSSVLHTTSKELMYDFMTNMIDHILETNPFCEITSINWDYYNTRSSAVFGGVECVIQYQNSDWIYKQVLDKYTRDDLIYRSKKRTRLTLNHIGYQPIDEAVLDARMRAIFIREGVENFPLNESGAEKLSDLFLLECAPV